MKTHLIIHRTIMALLVAGGAVAFITGGVSPFHPASMSLQGVTDVMLYALAFFGAAFGIRKTSRFEKTIADGCDIVVATAEAKFFPYFFYLISAIMVAIRWMVCLLR